MLEVAANILSNNNDTLANALIRWNEGKLPNFLPLWHKHAHFLKRPSSITEHTLALNVLYAGPMYIIRVQPQREFKKKEKKKETKPFPLRK